MVRRIQLVNNINGLRTRGGAHGSAIFLVMKNTFKNKNVIPECFCRGSIDSRLRHAGMTMIAMLMFSVLFLSGCKVSYPEDKVASSIKEICLQEYKIENVANSKEKSYD